MFFFKDKQSAPEDFHPPEVAHNLHGGEIRGIATGNRLGTDGWFRVVLGEPKHEDGTSMYLDKQPGGPETVPVKVRFL